MTLGIYLTSLGGESGGQDEPLNISPSLYEAGKVDHVFSLINRTGQSLDTYWNNINGSKAKLDPNTNFEDLLQTTQMAALDFEDIDPFGEK